MAKRNWIFGSLCLAIGVFAGHLLTRAGMATGKSTTFDGDGIPPPVSVSRPPKQESATLTLTDVTFCHKISGFGNYWTYDRDEFAPGQEVLLYAEIDDFQSEQTKQRTFRTLLNSTLEFFRDGEPQRAVERIDLPNTEDLCRRSRHDYFHSYQFAIPDKLTAGKYVLRLTVKDQLGHSEASRSLKFAIE